MELCELTIVYSLSVLQQYIYLLDGSLMHWFGSLEVDKNPRKIPFFVSLCKSSLVAPAELRFLHLSQEGTKKTTKHN